MRDGERGAALLAVLLLVAIISIMAATGLERMRVSTRLAGNAGAIDQARGYAYAAEVLATTRVTSLLAQSPDRVSLAGGWSGRPFPLPVPNGLAVARVSDGGNCFNLNGLVVAGEPGTYSAYTPAIRQFARLLRLIRVPGAADAIAAATADWIDTDSSPIAGGVEDGGYAGYRTGGTLMADPSELRAVAGVTAATYALIRPWVCTLPKAELSKINVNTVTPEQAPLLAMLTEDTLTVAGAQGALLKRPALGWESPAEFWNTLSLAGTTADGSVQGQTAVTTQWFALRVDVAVGRAVLEERGLIDATALPARLVSRQWGEAS